MYIEFTSRKLIKTPRGLFVNAFVGRKVTNRACVSLSLWTDLKLSVYSYESHMMRSTRLMGRQYLLGLR